MDIDIQAIPGIMTRNHDPRFNVDHLLGRTREGLEQRIGDLGWRGRRVLVIDFSHQQWTLPGAGCLRRQSAYRCLEDRLDLYRGLPDESYDGIVLNLLPSWGDFSRLLEHARERLNEDGLFAFSAFGPDTLNEVARAWAGADDLPHVHPFVDMHHLGDAMLRSGLVRPVVDTEWVSIDYPDYDTLVRDLRCSGFANIHSFRRKSLTGKRRYMRFRDNLEALLATDGLSVTFEFVHGLGFARNRESIRVQPPAL
ncbi:MAG: hypothetical protein F4Z15_10100 [Gammaproteobacteria bacterium]|nr:hypothetical protein [Gammaproteobacteria bacterium]MYJ51799.1 hypothetical protein [Gammaproteobacteria bacterium]